MLVIDMLKVVNIIELHEKEFGEMLKSLDIMDASIDTSNRCMYFVTATEGDRQNAIDTINKRFGEGLAYMYKGICAIDSNHRLVRDIPQWFLTENNKQHQS